MPRVGVRRAGRSPAWTAARARPGSRTHWRGGRRADVHVSLATGVLAARLASTGAEAAVERTVQSLGYGIAPLDATATPPVATHLTPGYRRALWAVVIMNLGYGVVEGVGGFLADSQALKADALDFLGDGLITMLGLVAIGWRTTARARLALLQALFLALLGLAVLVSTGYRVFVQNEPVAGLMGVFGAVALVVNVAAAVVLIPHRAGDASVRAVWLFSRNDAIGNAAVVGGGGRRGMDGQRVAGPARRRGHRRPLPARRRCHRAGRPP
jgi:hypothetical protein